MDRTKERDNQTIKFLKWIEEYPGWWQLICTPNSEVINIQLMQEILKELAKESFYEVMLVVLMVHRKDLYMENLAEALIIKMLISQWKNGQKEQLIDDLIHHFD